MSNRFCSTTQRAHSWLNAALVAALSTTLFVDGAVAQPPARVPVHGFVADSAGTALDGDTEITFRLYDQAAGGTMVYETIRMVSVSSGYFDVMLGEMVPLTLSIFTDNTNLYLGMAVGTDAEMTPRLEVGSTPYSWLAAYALNAGQLGGLDASAYRLASDTVDFADLTNVPDDNDTLAGLSCMDGQAVVYSGTNSAFECGSISTTESDPLYAASTAASISSTDVDNWNTAVGWGDHSTAGYLTSFTESDPNFSASPARGITSPNIASWNTAVGWGDHSTAGYLTSFTESDPNFAASAASGISSTNITNWNTAFGWGDHSTAGYATVGGSDTAYVNASGDSMSGLLTANAGVTLGGGRLNTNGRAWILSSSLASSPDDLTPTATIINVDDSVTTWVMPFTVQVDGVAYNTACISTNGWVELDTTTCSTFADFGNEALPTDDHSGPFIAGYWDDLDTTTTNGLRYGSVGTAPNRAVYFDYDTVTLSGGNIVSFQITIHEGSGLINVRYRDPMAAAANGQSATIGFQTAGGATARAYPIVFNGKVLDDDRDDMSWSISPVR